MHDEEGCNHQNDTHHNTLVPSLAQNISWKGVSSIPARTGTHYTWRKPVPMAGSDYKGKNNGDNERW